MAVKFLTTVALVALAIWALRKARRDPLSDFRSLGYGALFTPLFLWYGFGRIVEMAPWQVPLYALGAVILLSALVYLMRLPRRLAPRPKPDLLDMLVDGVFDLFDKDKDQT